MKKNSIFIFLPLFFTLIITEIKGNNPLITNNTLLNSKEESIQQDSIVFQNTISAYDLYSAFQKDKEEAKRVFSGKTITVRGIAVYVGPDVYALPSVELSDKKGGKDYVLCVLPFSDYLKLKNISKGENVAFSCECRGVTDEGLVVMKKCKSVK